MWQWVDEKERRKERKKNETKTGKAKGNRNARGRGKGSRCYFHNNFLIRKLQVQFSWKTPKRTGQSKQAKRKQIKDNFPKCISNELQPKVARPQLLPRLLLEASERANKLMTTSGKRRKEPSQGKPSRGWAERDPREFCDFYQHWRCVHQLPLWHCSPTCPLLPGLAAWSAKGSSSHFRAGANCSRFVVVIF